MADSVAFSAEIGSRMAARAAWRSHDWRDQDWMQTRWKTAKQSEEQDQVGSGRLMRSRHIRQDRAPDEDDARKDWILERPTEVDEDEDWWQSR